jgi:sulfonate transport system ATP-binding protein
MDGPSPAVMPSACGRTLPGETFGKEYRMADGSLQIGHVSKTYRVDGRALEALDDIDLTVAPGEFITIVGASGCGKSTLLRIIAGLDTSFHGAVLHNGIPVTGPSLERGIVFQEPRLFPWLTVEQNVALGLENAPLGGAVKRKLTAEHIALVGLSGFEKAYPRQLSGGMAQRAAIARSLVNRPGLLLLDEPFGALDALTRAHLQTELQRIWKHERITAVLVTHDVDEAALLGDRVVVMAPRPGRIAHIFPVAVPRPRDRRDDALLRLRNEVLDALEATQNSSARNPVPAQVNAEDRPREIAPSVPLAARGMVV